MACDVSPVAMFFIINTNDYSQLFEMSVHGKWNLSFWLLLTLCLFYGPVWTINKNSYLSIKYKCKNLEHKLPALYRS